MPRSHFRTDGRSGGQMRLGVLGGFCISALDSADSGTQQDWPLYGGGQDAWSHGAFDQITRYNVKRLRPGWVFRTGVSDGRLQATPIVVYGVMYLIASWNRVFAIDAVSGKELWHYFYQNPRDLGIIYSPWNRGVAVGAGRVFMGTL